MSTPSTSAAPRPRAAWKRWRDVGVVVVCLAAIVVSSVAWYLGYFEDNPEFRNETETILRQLTGGEDSATEAYEDASFPFRETSLLASFVDRADRLTQTLGTFDEIASVEETEMVDTIRGKTARIAYKLKFSLVHTTGELSYLRGSDGIWRLLGFSIRVPLLLEEKLKRIDAEFDRIKAPDEITSHIDSILQDVSAGKGIEVRKKASPPFRESKSEPEFVAMLDRLERELGAFERRLAILSSGQNAGKNRAKVSVLLQYSKDKTTGTFEFIKIRGDWRLLVFKVAIPEPLLPAR